MGFLSGIRPRGASWGPEDDHWYWPGGSFYGGYSPSSSGLQISPETALRLTTVFSCVKVLSESIAQLPLHLMEQRGKTKDRAVGHQLYNILHRQPNSWMTASEFWGMAVAHIELSGNFYALKIGLENRPVLELVPLAPGAVVKVEQKPDYSITYDVKAPNGEIRTLPQSKIFHLRSTTVSGVLGINPIEHARETIGIGIASDHFLGNFFSKGLHPGAIIRHPLPLNAPAHKQLKDRLKEKMAGLGNAWEFMLIDEGMDITFPPVKLVDAQFLDLAKFTQSQICGLFRVPLMLVQAGDNPTTYASAEQFVLSFVTHALTPIVVSIEQAITRDLLTDADRGRYYPKFSMSGLLRGDIKTRYEAYQIGVNTEILSPNECRELEDLNPYNGGDEYRTRTSTVRKDSEPDPEKKEPKK